MLLAKSMPEFLYGIGTRGDLSYLEFSKKTGLSHTTLHRIEKGEHHLTLLKLGVLLRKLKVKLSDVFPEEY